jgi:7,8-dihydroneopterin 2',3'-cyclic phosphate phosphodiesterase
MTQIQRLTALIKDEILRKKVDCMINGLQIEGDYNKLGLEESPGGAFQHHSYKGGLLQHMVSVTRIASLLSELIEEVYGGTLNKDYVIAGTILHDIMKCYTYTYDSKGGFTTSELGEKIDHLSLLVSEMYQREFPIEVIHIVASHHGDVSPVRPKTVEALITSIADMADSELNRRILRAAEYLIRKTTGKQTKISSSKEALEIIHTKKTEGWEGLSNYLNAKKVK